MLTRRQAFFAATAVVALGATGIAYAADKGIKIGVDLSLTGADSQGANRVRNAIVMAFDEANQAQAVPGHRFDLLVTGEGRFDWQSLHGKVVSEVASRALAHAVPTVVVAGEVLVGRREQSAAGITAAYAVGESPVQVAAALAAPAQTLAARAARVARTWSR